MRLSQHNSGFSSFTSKASDWQLKFAEEFSSRSLATLREKEIKAKKSRKYVEWLIECKGTKYWKMSVNPLILPTIQN
jgi:putative endonuclease